MIHKHIVNIGYPRCGTSWLWTHAGFQPTQDKENQILMTSLNFKHYLNYFGQFDVSANFQPNLWYVDREIIKFVQQHATHISIIVRNPYNFVERFYDWIHRTQLQADLVNYIINSGYVRYCDVINRWRSDTVKFKIFLFDDLQSDPQTFLQNYLTFCALPAKTDHKSDLYKPINANPKQIRTTLKFTAAQINVVNQEIDKFQQLVDRDLSHWKK